MNDAATPLSSHEEVDCGTTYIETEHYVQNQHYQPNNYSEEQEDDTDTSNRRSGCMDDHTNKHLGEISSMESLRDSLASDVIVSGDEPYTMIVSPFENKDDSRDVHTKGSKYYAVPLIYCDQTASNRPVKSIERYIERTCLPYYGNTHTNTSITGSQSTAFVAEARQIIAEETNAKITGKASLDIVLFTGSLIV
jgi:hypothetical protein